MRAKQISLKFDTRFIPALINRPQTHLKSDNISAQLQWRSACVPVRISKPSRSVHLHEAKNVVNNLCRENETRDWRPCVLHFQHYRFRYNQTQEKQRARILPEFTHFLTCSSAPTTRSCFVCNFVHKRLTSWAMFFSRSTIYRVAHEMSYHSWCT